MAAHSRILAWRIPWTEEPDGVRGCKEPDTVSMQSRYNKNSDCINTNVQWWNDTKTDNHSFVSNDIQNSKSNLKGNSEELLFNVLKGGLR